MSRDRERVGETWSGEFCTNCKILKSMESCRHKGGSGMQRKSFRRPIGMCQKE